MNVIFFEFCIIGILLTSLGIMMFYVILYPVWYWWCPGMHLCGITLVGPNFKNPMAPLFKGPDPDPSRERRWKELFSTVDVNGNGAVEILRLQFLKISWNDRRVIEVYYIAPKERRFLSSHIGSGSDWSVKGCSIVWGWRNGRMRLRTKTMTNFASSFSSTRKTWEF